MASARFVTNAAGIGDIGHCPPAEPSMALDTSSLAAPCPDVTSAADPSPGGESLGSPGPASPATASSAPEVVNDLQGQVGWLRECLDHFQTSEASETNNATPISGWTTPPMQPLQPQPNGQPQHLQQGLPVQDCSRAPEECQPLFDSPRARLEEIAKDSPAVNAASSLPSSIDQADPAADTMGAANSVDLQSPATVCLAASNAATSQHEPNRCQPAGEDVASDAQAAESSTDPVKHQEQGSLTQDVGLEPTVVSSSGPPDRAATSGRACEGQPEAVVQAAEHAGPEVGTPNKASHGKDDCDQQITVQEISARLQGRTPALADPGVHLPAAACTDLSATAAAASCLHDAGDCIIDTDPAASSDQPLTPVAAGEAMRAALDQASSAGQILAECMPVSSRPLEESFAVDEHGEASSSSSQIISAAPAQPHAVSGLLSFFTPPHVRPGRVIWGPVLKSPWASCTQIDGPHDVEKLLAHKYQLPLSATAFSSVFFDNRDDLPRKHTDICWAMACDKAQLDEERRQRNLQQAAAKAARNAAKRRKQRERKALANTTEEDSSPVLGTGTRPKPGPAGNDPEHAPAAALPAASASAPHMLGANPKEASHQQTACQVPAQPQSAAAAAILELPSPQPCSQNEEARVLPAAPEPTALQPDSVQPSGSQKCKAGGQPAAAPATEGETPTDSREPSTNWAAAASPTSVPSPNTAKPAGSDSCRAPKVVAMSTSAADARGKVTPAQGSESQAPANASTGVRASAAAESTAPATAGPPLNALDSYLRGTAALLGYNLHMSSCKIDM